MTHVKLRPLVVITDPVSSQHGYNDFVTPEASPAARAMCALPSPSRSDKSLAPAPPERASSGTDDSTGVSKLRSKLRRLLGAHSSTSLSSSGTAHSTSSRGNNVRRNSNSVSLQAGAATSAPAQLTNLRSASSHDLNERPCSMPVSPLPVGSASTQGRFSCSSIMLSPSGTTPPATPGSGCTSPAPGCLRTPAPTPMPPAASPAGGLASGRSSQASASHGARGGVMRRAVSFSPANTTFPPLSAPSPPPMPPGAAPGAVGARPSSMTCSAFARTSNMLVVPEDEALPEDQAVIELGKIVFTNTSSSGQTNAPGAGSNGGNRIMMVAEQAARQCGHPGGGGEVSAAAAAAALASPSPMPWGDAGGAATAPQVMATSPASSARQGSLRPMSPHDPRVTPRSASSSSSSIQHPLSISSGQQHLSAAALAAARASVPANIGLGDRDSSDSEGTLHSRQLDAAAGPFSVAAAMAAALSDTVPSHMAMRAASSSKSFVSKSDAAAARRPSSPTVGRPASPRLGGAAPLPTHTSAPNIDPLSPQGSLNATTAFNLIPAANGPGKPGLTRGMSAFNLMSPAGVRGSFGTASSSPWNSMGGSSAAAALGQPAQAHPAAAQAADLSDRGAAGPVPGSTSLPAPAATSSIMASAVDMPGTGVIGGSASLKQAPIRRAFSTVEGRPSTDSSASAPGVVLALGASMPPEMKRKEWRLEDFTMLKRLYKGNYSSVHKALCRISMRLVVIKVYDTTRMTELARNHVKREATLHAPLEHENILNLYSVFSQGPYVMLVEEVAEGGDLYHVLKGVPGHRLQEDRAVPGVLVPLLRALAHLHEKGICHRDIKLENILFSDRQHTCMLLADFGIALSLRHERAVTRAGTTEYMSPEQLRCPFKRHPADNKDRVDLHYGLEVDVWATGVLAYELLHGYPPFLGNTREETEQLIVAADVLVAPQLSAGARDFVVSCLQKDACDRPTVHQLLQHPWIRQHARPLRVGA